MDAVDRKSMTASELLRWVANGEENEYGTTSVQFKLFEALSNKPYFESTRDDDACNIHALADKIDAEIEAARRDARNMSFLAGFDARIALFDYPCRKNETLDEWIERCFIQLPLDENGEPVQFGDRDIDWDYIDGCRVPGLLNATAVDIRGKLLATTFNKIIAVAKTDEHGRVKRRAHEVLGGDGEPIVVCETVWDTESGKELYVSAIVNADAGLIQCSDDDAVYEDYDARYLTHTPPDTQERIDADARKSTFEYWGCGDAGCDHCPAKIEGKIPRDRLDARNCEKAMLLDVLRRQRELDKRKGGAE